jgi:hypothetical protein
MFHIYYLQDNMAVYDRRSVFSFLRGIGQGGVTRIPILEGNIIFLTIYEPSTEILIIIA